MDEIIKHFGSITGIHSETVKLAEPFINFAARFAPMPGTVILMSGGDTDCARYNILGSKPWLAFSGRKQHLEISSQFQKFLFTADPFDFLQKILAAFDMNGPDSPVPVAAGLMGYLSYDLKDCLEELPGTTMDDLNLPDISLFAPSILVVHDKMDNSTLLCIPERNVAKRSSLDMDLAFFKKTVNAKPPETEDFYGHAGGFRSNFRKKAYIDAINTIREYIASGHVYQVNMSQRFELDFHGDAFDLFKTLFAKNPAPFFAYVNAGSHRIVSTSPERFIMRKGNKVETRPIKGTAPRGGTALEDEKNREMLLHSKKDEAELSMIVDLLRNDLGKVCSKGSVRVTGHKKLEQYQNVYHLVSIVEGNLDKNRDSVDLIKATFPGGSITGCPKIRAMEIIDELEPVKRHVYTGSIGYISFHDTMDLSIAIRTATIYNDKIFFSVGGGIVFDSDPGDEFDETIHKGRTLLEAFGKGEKECERSGHVWINGKIEHADQAAVPVMDPGFQYGYGFFETIRVDKREPKYLAEHINRFDKTWKKLFPGKTPDLCWDKIIDQVIVKNRLNDQTAAVKIIAAMGARQRPPYNHTLVVTARPYISRLEGKKERGLNLVTFPEPRQTPLADHKTLNYLYYLLAGKWAGEKGGDEALILNPDKTVSETNTANILIIRDKSVTVPSSSHVLGGVMEKIVCRLLAGWGYGIEQKSVRPEELLTADYILVTNSLIGALPVLSINGKKLKKPSDLWNKINKILFSVT